MKLLYVPCRDEAEAKKLSAMLLERKLCACTNCWPVRSFYMWKGQAADEGEFVMLAKTTESLAGAARDAIRNEHSYELPAILEIDAGANEEYEEWLKKEVAR